MAFENQWNCESSKDVQHSTFHTSYISSTASSTYSVYSHDDQDILWSLFQMNHVKTMYTHQYIAIL